jgi:PAS domain S-box-containing protein
VKEPLHILLIEDDSAHVELIQRAFEYRNENVRLACVSTLAEARDYLTSSAPHLIIADWRLPDGDSLELIQAGEDIQPIPIIIMTSYGNENIAVDAMKAGALDYVVKSQEVFMDMPHIAERAIQQWEIFSERERIQVALRQSEAQFRLLAENSTDLIARLDPQGVFLYVSPACQALLGWKPEDLVGQDASKIVHPDDRAEAQRVFARILQQPPTTITFTHRAQQQDHQYIWLENTIHAIFDETGTVPVEVHFAARDITQRKLADEQLQSAHHALEDAYEATLNGWSRALELRDRETQGHSRRVMDMTLKLARAVGVSPEEIQFIRWGVLLHDIGKLGVPDEILRKPGPLTDLEWEEMRRHPSYAFDMLYPVTYLHNALDIPFCHHEKWDGSGYPRGLKGQQIPLAARVFAIVDVWDALSNKRPYRESLRQEEVLAYIRKEAGKHFDPSIVKIFLSIIEAEPLSP